MSDSIQREESYGVIPFVRIGDGVHFLVAHENGRNGFWKFPKGGEKEGEDPQTTALRELREETGIEIDSDALIRSRTFSESYFFNDDSGAIVRKLNTFYLGEMEKIYTNPDALQIDQKEFDDSMLGSFEDIYPLLQPSARSMLSEARSFLSERFNL